MYIYFGFIERERIVAAIKTNTDKRKLFDVFSVVGFIFLRCLYCGYHILYIFFL